MGHNTAVKRGRRLVKGAYGRGFWLTAFLLWGGNAPTCAALRLRNKGILQQCRKRVEQRKILRPAERNFCGVFLFFCKNFQL